MFLGISNGDIVRIGTIRDSNVFYKGRRTNVPKKERNAISKVEGNVS